jgi:hypothetical protein
MADKETIRLSSNGETPMPSAKRIKMLEMSSENGERVFQSKMIDQMNIIANVVEKLYDGHG